jgi:hypothetical protein
MIAHASLAVCPAVRHITGEFIISRTRAALVFAPAPARAFAFAFAPAVAFAFAFAFAFAPALAFAPAFAFAFAFAPAFALPEALVLVVPVVLFFFNLARMAVPATVRRTRPDVMRDQLSP